MQLVLSASRFHPRSFLGRSACALALAGVATAQGQTSLWNAQGDAVDRGFGWKVAGAGDVDGDGVGDFVVGCRNPGGNNFNDPGHAYLYRGRSGGLPPVLAWEFANDVGPGQGDSVGFSVDGAGDVNGDGFDDVIVGAARSDNGQVNEGRVYVFLGGPSGLSAAPAWSAESNQNNAEFGFAVAGIGDVNGDDCDDIAVGAPFYDVVHPDDGRVFVYLGSPRGLSIGPAWTYDRNVGIEDEGALLGFALDGAGDVNRDGYADLIVGARDWARDPAPGSLHARGAVFAFYGSASGLPAAPSWTLIDGTGNYIDLGYAVAGAGNFNGPEGAQPLGYDDVLITAKSGGQGGAGSVRMYLGGANGLSASEAFRIENQPSPFELGSGIGGAGNFDGDPYGDFVIGARLFGGGGNASVYFGNASGTAPTALPLIGPAQTGSVEFGQAVAGVGDIDGDGRDDVAVGAWKFDAPNPSPPPTALGDAGRIDVYTGAPQPLPVAVTYCTAKTNSQGCTPAIGFSGTPSASGNDDFVISAVQVLNNKSGLLFWAHAPAQAPFQGGTRCVAAPSVRTPLSDSAGAPPPDDCSGAYAFQVSHAYMAANGLALGDTLFAQWWSRDPASTPFHSGLTDALRFTISP